MPGTATGRCWSAMLVFNPYKAASPNRCQHRRNRLSINSGRQEERLMPTKKAPQPAAGSKRLPCQSNTKLESRLMNIRKLDHVSFLVRDVERSRRFYSHVLELGEIALAGAAIEHAG